MCGQRVLFGGKLYKNLYLLGAGKINIVGVDRPGKLGAKAGQLFQIAVPLCNHFIALQYAAHQSRAHIAGAAGDQINICHVYAPFISPARP